MKTEKEAVGGESAAETKQKEKTGCQENDSRTATNSTYKLKEHKKKGPWAEHCHQHLTVKLKDETLRPDSLGREHLLLTADSVLVRKNYRTVSVLSSAAVFFSLGFKDLQGVWGRFEVSHKVLNPLCLLFCLLFYYSVLDEVKKGENI